MYAEKISIISEISLFDIYRGKGVEKTKKVLHSVSYCKILRKR